MSRFFKGGMSSDEDDNKDTFESEEDYSSSSSEEEESEEESTDDESSEDDSGKGPAKTAGTAKASGASRFLIGAADSDDSDDSEEEDGRKGRVIKSAKDKKIDELRSIIKVMVNATKVNDWVTIQNEFDKLTRAIAKVPSPTPHRFYIRALVNLEDFLTSAMEDKAAIKKMNPSTSKAYNAMKQKIKKTIKLLESVVTAFRAAPVDEEESEDEAQAKLDAMADSEDDEGISTPKGFKGVKFEEGEGAAAGGGFTMVSKGGKASEITPENLFKKLVELLEARGKKSTDKNALVSSLKNLLEIAVSPFQKTKVLLALVPSQFDAAPAGNIPAETWKSCAENIELLIQLIETNPLIVVGDAGEDEELDDFALEIRLKDGQQVRVRGNIGSFVDRLDEEFTKVLQNMDPHTIDYIDRLRDESILYNLLVHAGKFFESTNNKYYADMIALKRIEHIYYKPDALIRMAEEACGQKMSSEPSTLIADLCSNLYTSNNERIRARALLCHVYHLANQDAFYKARDMLLMSHLQDSTLNMDMQTQVLLNRTMVQLGLAAFRLGLVKDTVYILTDICSSGKVRELLAQGTGNPRFGEKTVEQERLEKQVQLPFHMHINLELLECVFLTSCMLIEIPNMAKHAHDSRRKMLCKSFRRMLDFSERQVFTGPPETTRDYIMAASRAMIACDWEKCRDNINAIKIWALMPRTEKVKSMLEKMIQEESLKTYLFSNYSFYDAMSVSEMASMFALDSTIVVSLASKLIIHEEISASFDKDSKLLRFDRAGKTGEGLSRLNHLASTVAEKIGTLVDNNEKMLESRAMALGLQQPQGTEGQQRGGAGAGARYANRGEGNRGGRMGGSGRGGYRGGRVQRV